MESGRLGWKEKDCDDEPSPNLPKKETPWRSDWKRKSSILGMGYSLHLLFVIIGDGSKTACVWTHSHILS